MLERDSAPGLVCHGIDGPYTISSNPPNPKTSFRAGDWICSATNCAAHNFGRNSTCIACGRPRAADSHGMLARGPTYPAAPSPRFAAAQHDELLRAPLTRMHSAPSLSTAAAHAPLVGSGARGAGASPYPLLTPSGRALSVGGRVQNISSDPLAPCIMYWPDNEPLPEQGQIRPLGSAVITYPPIINTGNKGAAEKQPGDWVCQKCHYHNWRRRKVCQTCYPYAEGNGDSISAAVQAERIALLENVLATQVDRTRRQGSWPPVLSLAPASAGMHSAPPSAGEMRAPLSPLSPVSPLGPAPWQIEVRRTSLALAQDLRAPIYQTGGGHSSVHSNLSVAAHGLNGHNNNFDSRSISNHGMSHHSHGLSSAGLGSVYARELNALRPQPGATFLPSFLQDMVQSPSLSPSTSTSSADLSLEEGHDVRFGRDMAGLSAGLGGLNISGGGNGLKISGASRGRGAESTFALSGGSIWQMDGEESKTLATTPTAASVMRAPRVAVARPGSLERTH
ncbi:hypothetical protein WOLCODRAFT_121468 [Wolfiporia cocos MD-104 SS10]|uniref:RanBP2-type domain-containing protein n=1 Tax=Wolfiporia cocos (strain MD-104) TaxID=742152 RepID=A0A2H3JLJ5_WOLCO|nr:hypothetical protein WOLCODRAFT_121468 [Wolfiporia cocos MD-104 SS10]